MIDLRTGQPFDKVSQATMENWYPQSKKSADELAAYLAYALRILKNCGLPCQGVTTPGCFGNQTLWMKISELARYWAARKLTRINRNANQIVFNALFASPQFTIRITTADNARPTLAHKGKPIELNKTANLRDLKPGT